ncbi:MAG: GH36-type glycosyl hydrolase domain-containing protein [Anaerolineae bacterium]
MSRQRALQGWHFIDQHGTFRLDAPHKTSYLYFPLVNEAGMISVVTPTLHGDAKTGQNTFLLPPVSVEDLHLSRAARNFWVRTADGEVWSATGNSAAQIAGTLGEEAVTLEAGILWHKVTRTNPALGLRAEITNVVPASDDAVELLRVTLTNVGAEPVTLTPTAAVPIYGRSADNLRDHRHVTSLLHRIRTQKHGVLVTPTLSFDERGHTRNTVTYAVLGAEADGAAPVAFFPIVEDFVGEGGTLDWPAAVVEGRSGVPPCPTLDGYEALGGLRFAEVTLAPGENQTYVLILGVLDEEADPASLIDRYGTQAHFEEWFAQTVADWRERLSAFAVTTGDARFDTWMQWVALQPTLRRRCGNSFLPYHDYGRGGRGWRDLWQDLLSLLLMAQEDVRPLLLGNFAGVRMDGSNATIIGAAPGEFKADRNDIPRVWMDHGAWPLLTTQLYIDYTGDLAFLLAKQAYFKDAFTHRAQQVDEAWQPEDGTVLKATDGSLYRGTVLEHMLVQHLTAFFNVGKHNIIRLEGADWNDGLDMAPERGESVAFTALYAGNLRRLARLVRRLEQEGVTEVALAVELQPLLDTLATPVDYDSVAAKQDRLQAYFDTVQRTVTGKQITVAPDDLARDLDAKADWLIAHLRKQEWIENAAGYGWFNGYYDNDGRRVEGDHPKGVRMTLTGQVFALMTGVASDEQAAEMVRAVNHYLYDESVGGPRLNTDFGEVLLNLGRCFGFAYGHKENGAMFTHMAVMYANALYQRDFVREGYHVLNGIYRHSQDFAVSRMYPGLPEYVTPRGRGVYPYLTGSASWYLLTLIMEVFGVQGHLGDLWLTPRLVQEQFDAGGRAGVHTRFADRALDIVYRNPEALDYGEYLIAEVTLDGVPLPVTAPGDTVRIERARLTALDPASTHCMEIVLHPRRSKTDAPEKS